MPRATLTYFIFEGLLTGNIDGNTIQYFALSGGGGGTKAITGPQEPGTVNNPYRTDQKEGKGIRGGPIPPGRYTISKPSTFHHKGRGARLTPEDAKHFNHATGRDGGFWIHGRGPLGSDGCIVPLNLAEFNSLMDALTETNGGQLTVLQTVDGGAFV